MNQPYKCAYCGRGFSGTPKDRCEGCGAPISQEPKSQHLGPRVENKKEEKRYRYAYHPGWSGGRSW